MQDLFLGTFEIKGPFQMDRQISSNGITTFLRKIQILIFPNTVVKVKISKYFDFISNIVDSVVDKFYR